MSTLVWLAIPVVVFPIAWVLVRKLSRRRFHRDLRAFLKKQP